MVAFSLIATAAAAIAMHPLHTSFAQVTFDQRNRSVEVSLRVFIDDYTSAAGQWARSARKKTIAPELEYALATFTLRDQSGNVIALASCGEKRVGDLMWLCLRGHFATRPAGARVISRILFEKFDDQVNIVQASYDGRKANLLFTSDDTEKRLP